MSFVALATASYDAMTHFYGVVLGCRVISEWDRPGARGCRLDLGGGLRLELLDRVREKANPPIVAAPTDGRFHLVIEVPDIAAAHRRLPADTPLAARASWGAHVFQVHDPDGTPITFLQWDEPSHG